MRRLYIAIAAALAAILAAVTLAATSRADSFDQAATAFCTDLYNNPTPSQIDAAGELLMEAGLTADQAAEFIVKAVFGYCPENIAVLKRYIAQYGGTVA